MNKLVFLAAAILMTSTPILAAENSGSVTEEIKETGGDVAKGIRKGARAASDKACEMVNGKMECAAKKMKHKGQNLKDEVKDKTDTN